MYKSILARGILLLLVLAGPTIAQSPPTDLTELDIEEILALHIRRSDTPSEEPARWSLGYRLVFARFDGNRDGTEDLSIEDVIWNRDDGEARTTDNFPVVPLEINQQAHLFDIGYDLGRSLSVNVLIPFIHQSTDHCSIIAGFEDFVISSSGIGDIALSATTPVRHRDRHVVVAHLGLSLPIGSIDEIGPTPRDPENDTQLPYTMQIGSGTIDLLPGIVYSGSTDRIEWGARGRATLRLGESDRNYTLGNRLSASGWIQKRLRPWVSPNLRLTLQKWGRIDGRDADLQIDALPVSPYPAAVTDPDKFGGTKLHVSVGSTFSGREGLVANHSLSLDFGIPVYQHLNGPQPKEIFRLSAGWKWSL
ncbi:MAG: hypothetical protein HOH74_10585 [Gemmatimonadetes bacterium]|nr:hypothetical protein [Gemmatimonadota bacterium]